MKLFKIENYERVHGKGTFMHFRALPQDEVSLIAGTISRQLGLPANSSGIELVTAIRDKSTPVEGVSASQAGFNLGALFTKLQLDPPPKIYLNWYRFDRLDEIALVDAVKYFGDYWYPAADDLDLIDSAMRWILSVDHDGRVDVLRLPAS